MTETGKNLIFLISQPRAGSTFTQKILGSHSQIHTISEPWLMLHPLYALKNKGYKADYNSDLARIGLKSFLEELPRGENTYFEGIRKMYSYLYNCALEKSGKHYFLDKTPRYYNIIPELYKTFPDANYLVLLRNPLAVLCSTFNTWGRQNFSLQNSTYSLDLIEAPKLLVKGIKKLKNKCLVIHYEKLISEPETIVKKIYDYLKINFEPQTIDYNKEKNADKWRFGDQDKVYINTRPDKNNLDKWIQDLTNPQLWSFVNEYFMILGENLIEEMGYSYQELKQIIEINKPRKKYLLTDFHSKLGKISLERKQFQPACDYYQKALQLEPDNPDTQKNFAIACEKLLDLAIEHHQAGRLSKANTCYQQVLNYQPRHADAWHLWGVIAHQQKQEQIAIERFNRAIELNPTAPVVYNNLATAHLKQNRFTEAIDCYKKTLQLQPDNSEAHYNLGIAYQQQGHLSQAIDSFQKTIQLQPKNNAAVHHRLGNVYIEEGKLDEALASYDLALKQVLEGRSADKESRFSSLGAKVVEIQPVLEYRSSRVNLLIEFFRSSNQIRNAEYLYTLHKNLDNEQIDKIYIFVEEETELNFSSEKIEIVRRKNRPTYKDLFEFCNENLNKEICVVANGDIIFDDTLGFFKSVSLDQTFFALSRWEILSNGCAWDIKPYENASSQDSWIFKAPIPVSDEMNFTMGTLACDNKIAILVRDLGYIIKNPGKNIITVHFHLSQHRTYLKKGGLPGPYLLVPPTDHLNGYPENIEIDGFDQQGRAYIMKKS